jgi:hypothetical protein
MIFCHGERMGFDMDKGADPGVLAVTKDEGPDAPVKL